MLVLFVALFAWVAGQIVFAEKEATVYIFPAGVESEGWDNAEHALVQDLSLEAELVDFTSENSATLGWGVAKVATTTEGDAVIVPNEVSPEEKTIRETTPLPASEVVPPPSTETTPIQEAEEQAMSAPRGLDAFFSFFHPLVAQANEDGTTTPALDNVVTSTPPLSAEVMPTPAQAVLEKIEAEGRSDVTLCHTLSRDCHTMTFGGFGLGGALEDRKLLRTSVALSLATHGVHGITADRIIVRAFVGGRWELLGEERPRMELSNAKRGGYLNFALPSLDKWEDLRDLKIQVEYDRQGSADGEILLDGLWLNAVYERAPTDGSDDALSAIEHASTNLATEDAALRALRRDTLLLPDAEPVHFGVVDDRADAGIVLKSDQRVYLALGNTRAYFNVTNTTESDQTVRLQFHFPKEGGRVASLRQWSHSIPVRVGRSNYDAVGYFCDAGWIKSGNASSSDSDSSTYACEATEEKRSCDSLNTEGTNCITANAHVDVTEDVEYRDGWQSVMLKGGSYKADEGLFARALDLIFGQLPDHAIPSDVDPVQYVGDTMTLASGATLYFEADMETALNSRGDFYVEAAAESGAYGLLASGWDGSWNERIMVTVDQNDFHGNADTFAVPIDLASVPAEFWAHTATSGEDIRFTDGRGLHELPYWLASFDREARRGLAWVRVPVDQTSTTSKIALYYGNAAAESVSDANAPFRTDKPTLRAVVIGGSEKDMNLHVVSLDDDVFVRLGRNGDEESDADTSSSNETIVLRKGESALFPRVSSGTVILATGPFTGEVESAGGRATLVPAAYAGTSFVIPARSGGRTLSLSSAVLDDARATLETSMGSSSLDVVSDSVVSAPITLEESTRLSAETAVFAAIGQEESIRTPLYPSGAEERYGFALGTTIVGAGEDGTAFTMLCGSGPQTKIDGRRAGASSVDRSCLRGTFAGADPVRIAAATHPIGAVDDEEKNGMLPLLPLEEFGVHSILPFDAKSIALLCAPGNEEEAVFGLTLSDGSIVATTTCTARGMYPGKALFVPPLSLDGKPGFFAAGGSVRAMGQVGGGRPIPFLAYTERQSGAVAILSSSPTSRALAPHSPRVDFGEVSFVVPGEHRKLDRTPEDAPKEHFDDLLLDKREFSASEHPTFKFRYNPTGNGVVRGMRSLLGFATFKVTKVSVLHNNLGELPIESTVSYGEGNEWSVTLAALQEHLRPGKYILHVEIEEGGETHIDEFDFYWGLLAINYQKSVFTPGEHVDISIGALSNNGNTICDAHLKLWVTPPGGSEGEIPVLPSGECNGNNIVSVPDYSAAYTVGATGPYATRVVRLDGEGNIASEAVDSFEVHAAVPYDIERIGPTRIYPLAHYPMRLRIHAHRDFAGDIVERIPGDFVVIDRGGADLERSGEDITATWPVDLKAGATVEFSYTFDAPDRSPYLFLLGPAELKGDGGFMELRKWQIASDAAGKMLIFWDRTYTPTGWTCLSCLVTDPFYQRFAMGSTTYSGTGGTATHTPTVSATVYTTTATGVGPVTTNNTNNTPLSHTHTLTPTVSGVSNLPAYRRLRVLQSNSAGDPSSIPGGAIVAFDVASSSLPSGWYRYAPLDGRYPMGEITPGVNGGANTHSHTVTGTLSAAVGSGLRSNNSAVSAASSVHTHALTSTSTDVVNNEPPYKEILFAQLPATTTPSNYMITMWDNTPPTGWTSLSDEGGPLNGKFLKASTTYGLTGGGSSHAHVDMIGAVTGVPSATNVYAVNASNGQAPGTHTHSVDVTGFSTDSQLPPYVEVIFAKRLSGIVLYDQSHYRVWNNANANTPTDPWPPGGSDLDEDTPVDAASTPAKPGDVLRLRMSLQVTNSTSTVSAHQFKLQYAESADCTTALNWNDVAPTGSSTAIWRGYDNAGVTNNVNSAITTLADSNVAESYVEQNNSTGTAAEIGVGQLGEWDWVVQDNLGVADTNYCFRMTKSDGTPLDTYTMYPEIYTNSAADVTVLSAPFDNEKVGTTTPDLYFAATDSEIDDLDYEIQMSSTSDFAVAIVDKDSTVNPELFDNISSPTNKAPFNSGDSIHFRPSSALVNGTTYWWRVRAKDSNASNSWGAWSTGRSFTVDTSVVISTWFQTTRDQFVTDTLVNVNSTSTTQNDIELLAGQTTGTVWSPQIDFSFATIGTAWGTLSWNDSETLGDIKYQIEYLDATNTWVIMPDADLSGNSAGFDTSPISLLTIDPSTYSSLRIRGNFTDVGGTPRLLDWTLAWGYKVTTPVVTSPFDNAESATATPSFDFSASDPQADSLTYEISWSTLPTFTSSTTRTSNTHAGFSNLTTPADTTPFNSGESMRFTVEGADALTNGTTYFYRVRAKDPTGANDWSFWSDTRSLTVDTSITVATWFQTANGQFDTDTLTSMYSYGTGGITVSTSTTEAMIGYGEGTVQTPRYRIWSGAAWGTELSAVSVGATIQWVVLRSSPIFGEYIMGTMGTDRDVNFQVYDNGAWGNVKELTQTAATVSRRGFDVTYETLSGRAIAVSCDGDADPSYSIWDGTSWSAAATIDLGSVNNCEWIRLASNPISNEIVLVERNTGNLYQLMVWNGTTWGNGTSMGSMTEFAHEGMAVEYEESGNQAIVVSSNGNNANFAWKAWSSGAWSATTTVTLGDDFEWGNLRRDKGSDNMNLCYVDHDGDIGVSRWTGAAFQAITELDAGPTVKEGRPTDCVFENTTGRDGYIMNSYSDAVATRYRVWTGAAWAAEASISTIGVTFTDQLIRTGGDTILGTFFDSTNGDYLFSSWNGAAWSVQSTLENTASVTATPFGEPFMMVPKNPATQGTVISTAADFDDGNAPAWSQVSWSATLPGSATFTVQVEYYNTASSTWVLIPDADLAGNSSGAATSPISITNLDTNTYNQLRLVGNATCVLGNCPTLNDWTIKWAQGIQLSGNIKKHDLSTKVTSGTVGVAVNGVLQVGKTGSVTAAGNWEIANVTVFPSNIVSVFVQGASASSTAVAVAKYTGPGDTGGITLNEHWITLGSASNTNQTISLTDMGLYDNSVAASADLFYDVSAGGDLSSCAIAGCSDAGIVVGTSTTFRPNSTTGKTLNTFDMRINGTLTADTNTLKVAGAWKNMSAFNANTSTVIFNATSSQQSIDSTGSGTSTFYNVTFGEIATTATWSASSSLVATGTMSVNFGTFSPGTQSVTVQGDLTIGASGTWTKGTATTTFSGTTAKVWTDNTASKQDLGNILIDGTAKTLSLGSSVRATDVTIGADDTFDAGSGVNGTITILGNWINNNIYTARLGGVTLAGTAPRTITPGTSAFYNLTQSGIAGTYTFTTTNATVTNNLTIATGTLTLPSGTIAVAGSYDNTGGTVTANGGILRLNGTASGKNLRMGTSSPLANIEVAGSGGAWTMMDAHGTTTGNITLTQGSLTLPSGTLAVGGSFENSGGTFTANNGTLKMTATSGTKNIRGGGSSFANILVSGNATFTIPDTNGTTTGDLILTGGVTTFPTGTFAVGGNFTASSTFTANGGTILFNPASGTKFVTATTSSFANVLVQGAGSLTFVNHATTTGSFTLTNANVFTLQSGKALSVGGTFTTALGGASTTWTNSTLTLNSGTSYTMNTKTAPADSYGELKLNANTNIRAWNSTSTLYTLVSTASLYSQDHNGTDGDLYIFGNYTKTSGTDYWDYATDFDGALLGGSSRVVRVRFAPNATSTFSNNSTLEIIGTGAGTTTIDRQGTGNYAITVDNSTINASYYSFKNANASGLSLTGTTTVTSLNYGEFELNLADGSMMTVASSTIGQNPALQILSVKFATSTGITSGFNVTETGIPTSYWRFRQHYGNYAGESFDNDPGGNPGYIRWDDSLFVINISGYVYSDAGVTAMGNPTCDNVTSVVRVKVNGGGSFAAPCNPADGAFTVSGVAFSGDTVMTTYLDTDGGARAVTVTRSAVSDITDMKLYKDRLIVRHEDVTPMSIADLNWWDSGDDSDVPYLAATSAPHTLSVNPETEFWIWSGKTFIPGGNITLNSGGSGNAWDGSFHIDNNAIFTAQGSESHSVGGKWTMDAGGTFTSASSTFTFTATTTGKAITIASGSATFWNTVFNGTGGNWSVNSAITVNGNLTMTAGTLSGAQSVTANGNVSGNGSVAMTGGTFAIQNPATFGGTSDWSFFNLTFGGVGTGATTKSGSSTVTVSNVLTIAANMTLNAGSPSTWNLSGAGTPFILNGTLAAQNTTFRYSSASATTITAAPYATLWLAPSSAGGPTYTLGSGTYAIGGNLVIGDGTFAGTTTANMNDPTMSVSGDVLIRASSTLVASDSGTFTALRDWTNTGTFTHSGGTVTFAATTTGRTITPGASPFGSVTLNSASGGWMITDSATTSNNFTLTAASSFTMASGATLEVDGPFTNGVGGAGTTWTGSNLYLKGGTSFSVNAKSSGADLYNVLEVGASTQVRMWNSSASTTIVSGTGSLYSQDHNAADGALSIWGAYTRSSGNDYWDYATDFDGASLTGGSERRVDVRFAPSASFTLSGGTLDITGASTASTTIDRQSTGNYAMSFTGGSATGTFMTVRNVDTNGFNFSGSALVNSLSDSDFQLGVEGGTMITVTNGVIDANPLQIFQRNRFATSTGITTGFNVKAVGVSASVWRFNLAYGNYGSEAYDSDPGGDPGELIWDDSAANVTISGNVYSDEGSTPIGGPTCDGVTQSVRLKVQGAGLYASACNAGTGAFSISNVIYNPGDTLSLYLDTDGGAKAANISIDPTTNIANMHLYQNRVIVRHEEGNPITIAKMDQYDMDNDTDIPFKVTLAATNTLSILSNTELIVWDSKVFAPVGNVTLAANASANVWDGTVKLQPNAVWSAATGEAHSVGGHFLLASGASLAPSSSTFTFTATTTGKTIAASSSIAFYNLTQSGIAGTYTFTTTNATVTNNLTIATGTLTLPSGTIAVAGSYDNTGGTVTANGGILRLNGTASGKNLRMGTSSPLANIEVAGSGGAWTMMDAHGTTTGNITLTQGSLTLPSGTLAVGGSFENSGGTFTANNGTLKMTATGGTKNIRGGGSSFGSILVSGSTTFTIPDTNATTTGDLILTGGVTTFPTGTFAVGGNFTASSTFTANGGTVLFTPSFGTKFVTATTSSFANVLVQGTGSLTVVNHATTTGSFTLTNANVFTLQSGKALSVGGTFTTLLGGASTTWTGSTLTLNSGTSYTMNTKTAPTDSYGELKLTADTNIRAWNSTSTLYALASTASLYSQDHNGVDGDLYLFGNYARTSGADYWSYATDFDGTALGGSSRAVRVRLAQNATSTFSNNSNLEIVGISTATTTIDRQGTGNYAITVDNSTLNASYYSFKNANASGLSLSGTTTVTALGNGYFELSVNGGSLITIASSTIAQNASQQYTLIGFATTTGITGVNVTRTGTTSNSITLRSTYGQISGETSDQDGLSVDACGAVRFDDSACLFVDQQHYRFRNDDGGEGVPSTEWYDASWTRRKRVTITNNSASAVANAQVKFDVGYDSDMLSNWNDVRFTDSSGTTSIPFWVERYTTSATATIWAKIPNLPASGTADIFAYYGNGSAASAGSGTSTFSFFDDFEDAGISEYSGDTSLFAALISMNQERSYGVGAAAGSESSQTTSGVGQVSAGVGRDTTFRFFQYINMSSGGSNEPCMLFAVQSPITSHQNYGICLQPFGQDKVVIAKNVANNGRSDGSTLLVQKNVTYSTGWYEVSIDWIASGNQINVSVYDATGALFATTTASDSSYTSGGIGFSFWGQHGGWDIPSARTYIAATPSVSTGLEQQNSGASWKAVEDTLHNNQLPNQNVRLRFTVKNSGTPISDQNFRLQVANKSIAPNCESVASANYSDVTITSSSCGSSPACMTSSSQFTNRASSTQLLSVSTGFTFTPGQIIEDPTNDTLAMSVPANNITEVEYNFQMTAFATQSAYCFRTTNSGAVLDNYSKVAELKMLHAPFLTNWALNGGSHIALTEGTTTLVSATGTVTDYNGYTDISAASSTLFRSSVSGGAMCTANQNNCYQIATSSCATSSCGGNSCTLSCSASVQYFADPTDPGSAFSSDTWQSNVDVWDQSSSHGTASANQELYTLKGLSVPAALTYGSVTVGGDSGSTNGTTSVTNTGNTILNLDIGGDDLRNGASSITYNQQKYATSTFTYGACAFCSTLAASTSPAYFGIGVPKPTSTTAVSTIVYWGINIPLGTAAMTHTGSNTFTAN
jgi:lipopolysaccharide export system protein LptA